MKNGDIKGVIFDVDGVLLDTMPVWKTLGSGYLHTCGVQPPQDLDKTLFSMSMEQGAEYLHENFLHDKSARRIYDEMQMHLEDFYVNSAEAKPGVAELLRRIEHDGIPMAAATSSPRVLVAAALERNGILQYIKKLFTTGEMNTSKSSPLIYNTAARYLGTTPSETLVFEDSLYALRTASQAGFVTVGVVDIGEPNAEALMAEADVFVRSYEEWLNKN